MANHDVPPRTLPQRAQPEGCGAFKKRERCIAIDATGFSTETYACWRNHKPGISKQRERDWLKLHAAVTTVMKAIPSMEVTEPNVSDSLKFKSLLESLPLDDIEAVTADSAYLSRQNCDFAEEIGAKPYIKLKKNIIRVRSAGSKAWSDMIFSYRRNPKAWERVYHARSSAETAFSAIKRKFGHQLSSIRRDHQRKELMIRIVAYNLNIVARKFI